MRFLIGNFVAIRKFSDFLIRRMLAMMSVLVKASVRSIEAVLTELVFDNSEAAKYKELCKFGFEDFLWDEIAKEYDYSGDQKIESLNKKFLFTAMLEQDVELGTLPSFYKQFIIEGEGKNGAKSFVHHLKQDSRYRQLQLNVATDLKIDGLFSARDIGCVGTSDIFECTENYVIKKISESLLSGSLDYDVFVKVINDRNNSMWQAEYRHEYEFLRSAIEFLRLLEHNIPQDLTAVEYIKLYANSLYKVDMYYRHLKAARKADLKFHEDLAILEQKIKINGGVLDEIKEDYKRRQGNIVLNAVRTIRAYTPRRTARGKVNDKTLKRRAGIRTRVFGRTLGKLFSYFGEQSELLERDFSHRLQDIEKEIEERRLQEQEVENTKTNSKWTWGK